MPRLHEYLSVLLLAAIVAAVGCAPAGPATGKVEGTVTLDDAPLPNATVMFYPTEGRAAIGCTDEDGHYTLRLTGSINGAIPGENKVTISTARERDVVDGVEVPGSPETLPAKYCDRNQTELTAVVDSSGSEINFDLTSK